MIEVEERPAPPIELAPVAVPSKEVIWVEVTAALIEESRRCLRVRFGHRSVVCPIALALGAATGRLWAVDCHYVQDLERTPHQKTALPDEATAFVRAFDDNREVEPIRFSLEVT